MKKYKNSDILTGYRFAAVSVADNGKEPPEAVEVGITLLDGSTVGTTSTWLVRPRRLIAAWATRGHGLTDFHTEGAPVLSDVADDIQESIADRVIIAHRAPQCYDTLAEVVPAVWNGPLLDLRRLATQAWPSAVSQSLGALEYHVGLCVPGPAGRAAHDAEATARLLVQGAAKLGHPVDRVIGWATTPEWDLR